MASVEQCRAAVDELAAALADVDPDLRARHVPTRTIACRITDLPVTFLARLDEDGVHDVTQVDPDEARGADVRVALSSEELLSLAAGERDFLQSWLRGRVQVSASVRDLLRLRTLLGV